MMLHRRHQSSRDPAAPVLLVALEDVSDAGYARAGAASSLLRQGETELAASFDTDQLVDYRAQPPLLTAAGQLSKGIVWPEIRLELGADLHGQDWLLLRGPSPAYRWQAFGAELAGLATGMGVRMAATLSSVAAPVPHTRPSRVLAASTSPELLDQLDPHSTAPMSVTAGIDAAVAWALSSRGIAAVALSAQVPSYLTEAPYPPASAALLDTVGALAGLSIDTGRLHTAADSSRQRIDEYLGADEAHAERVRALERHFDTTTEDQRVLTSQVLAEEELVDELSQYLRRSEPGT